MALAEQGQQESAWVSVVIPADLKVWARIKAASMSKSTSAFIRELIEREKAETEPQAAPGPIEPDRA